MHKWILIFLMALTLPAMAQIQEARGVAGGADADSIKGIPVQDTTSNLSDNDVMRYNLANDQWEYEAPPGAGGGEANTASNLGIDADSIFYRKSGLDLEFRRLIGEGTVVVAAKGDTALSITGLVDSALVAQIALDSLGDHSAQNYLDNDDANVDTSNWITGYTHSQATGDQHSIKLNEVNDPDGNKTFGMGALGLKFNYTGAVANGLELNATGIFTGDIFHVHQHTGNVGQTHLVHFEATDVDVLPLCVTHVGRDTLSIFKGGLSQFDSLDANGALRADGSITTPNLIVNTDANIAADAVQDSSIANTITIDEASDVDTTGTKIAAALGFRMTNVGDTVTGTYNFSGNPLEFIRMIDFDDTITAPSHSEGRVFYDKTDNTLSYYNNEADVTMNLGQEGWVYARNITGSTILDGKVVYITGAVSSRPTIALAKADAEATCKLIGVATHDIETASNGYVTVWGVVRGINLSDFSDGDEVFLSAVVAGSLTTTAPSAPNCVVEVGYVIDASANGDLLVSSGKSKTLNSLGDVLISGPATGNVLVYDGSVWADSESVPVADSAGKALFAQQDADGDSVDISLLATIASPTFTGVVTIPDFLLTTGGADANYDPTDVPADGDQLTWNTGGTTDWQPAAGGAGEANVLADTGTFDDASGFGLTQTKAGVELRIRGLIEGNNITITKAGSGVNDTALVITASGGSGVWTERSDTLFAIDADGDTMAVFWDDDAGNVRWQVATEDQTLRALFDTLGLGGDVISEFAGDGLTVTSNELTADLGTEVDTLEITDAQWQEYIPDWAGSMFTGNTETGIVATYQDGDNTVDLVITAISGLTIDGNNALVVKPGTGLDTTGGTVFMDMTTDSTGTGNLARADSPTFTTAITVPANSISDEELDEGASFTWTAVHDFGGATSLEIPNADNPTTDANGEIAQDNNGNALEVYIPSESESGLIPFYRYISIPIVLPDSVQAQTPDLKVFHVKEMLFPHGIEIDSVEIQLDADAAYSMVIEEWSGADPPVFQSIISTVTTGGTDTYAIEAPDNDAVVDANDWIVLDIPTTDVPFVNVGIYYHVTEGN